MKKVLIPTKLDPVAKQLLETNGNYSVVQDESGDLASLAAQNPDTYALLVRSEKVTAEIIDALPSLKVVIRAGAGYNTIDIKYARSKKIDVMNTPGANANAVAEYVITAVHKWVDERGFDLQSAKVGIVGCGNTGGRVAGYFQKLGVQTVLYDPPKAEREEGFISAKESDLLKCDILTFHVPLTESGPHPTVHICSEAWLKHKFSLIVNTSRGGVVDEEALLKSHQQGTTKDYILDVWENEPLFDDEVAQHAFLTTPHIAGYSKEAKWKASEMVVNAMCEHFGSKKTGSIFHLNPSVSEKPEGLNSFTDFLWQNSNLKEYNSVFKSLIGLSDDEKSRRFAKLRSETETRFEFSAVVNAYREKSYLPDETTLFVSSN